MKYLLPLLLPLGLLAQASGPGGGTTSAGGLGDFSMAISGKVLTIGGTCGATSPCLASFGAMVYSVKTPCQATVTGGSGSAWVYVSSAGLITVAKSGITITGSGCNLVSGTQFPYDSVPLGVWSAAFGGTGWDIAGGVDYRSVYHNMTFGSGTGLVCVTATGTVTCSVDTTSVQTVVSVPSTSTTSCNVGQYALSTTFRYDCVGTNVWRRVAISAW